VQGLEAGRDAGLVGTDLGIAGDALQGLGKVGMGVAKRLHAEGAKLVVADTDTLAVKEAVEKLGAVAATPHQIVTVECDVLSPNALGAILNELTDVIADASLAVPFALVAPFGWASVGAVIFLADEKTPGFPACAQRSPCSLLHRSGRESDPAD
jgi:hypothetical protein